MERMASFAMDSRTTAKSLAYLNLYFTQQIATGRSDPSLLYMAAHQRYLGYIGRELTSDASREDKARRINELRAVLRTVKDLDSFNTFMVQYGKASDDTAASYSEQASTAHKNADRAATAYIITFAIGSLLLLFGIVDE